MQNLRVYYQSTENDQVRIMLQPTCRTEDFSQAQNTVPFANSPVGTQATPSHNPYQGGTGICVNNIPSCYCAKRGPANLLPVNNRHSKIKTGDCLSVFLY